MAMTLKHLQSKYKLLDAKRRDVIAKANTIRAIIIKEDSKNIVEKIFFSSVNLATAGIFLSPITVGAALPVVGTVSAVASCVKSICRNRHFMQLMNEIDTSLLEYLSLVAGFSEQLELFTSNLENTIKQLDISISVLKHVGLFANQEFCTVLSTQNALTKQAIHEIWNTSKNAVKKAVEKIKPSTVIAANGKGIAEKGADIAAKGANIAAKGADTATKSASVVKKGVVVATNGNKEASIIAAKSANVATKGIKITRCITVLSIGVELTTLVGNLRLYNSEKTSGQVTAMLSYIDEIISLLEGGK